MRVYLDNCCYNRPYDDQSQIRVSLETQAKLRVQRWIVETRLELSASFVLLAENDANPHETRRKYIRDFIERYASASPIWTASKRWRRTL